MTIEKLGQIFREKQISLAVSQQELLTKDEFDRILGGKYLSYDDTLEGGKINTGYNISYQEILELLDIKQENLEGKTIVDIGGGLSFLPFFMDGKDSDIKIVDPIFKQEIKYYIASNINSIKKRLVQVEKLITRKKIEISRLQSMQDILDITNIQDKIKYSYCEGKIIKLSEIIQNNEKRFRSLSKIINELEEWGKLSDNKISSLLSNSGGKLGNTNIKLIDTGGEDIIGIDNNSVDIIIINHVITKGTVNPNILLSNASKLLKVGGKIYITENDIIEFNGDVDFGKSFNVEVRHIAGLQDKTIVILTKILTTANNSGFFV